MAGDGGVLLVLSSFLPAAALTPRTHTRHIHISHIVCSAKRDYGRWRASQRPDLESSMPAHVHKRLPGVQQGEAIDGMQP